jgi:type IV pilus assembly protein PilA
VVRRLLRDERGFSLIELLVVILVIGVLAAIALPMFLGKSEKASDADAKSIARDLVTYMDSCYVGKEDFRLCATQADSESPDLPWGTNPGQVTVTNATKTTYEIVAVSKAVTDGANHSFTIERSIAAGMTRSCSGGSDSDSGCHASTW